MTNAQRTKILIIDDDVDLCELLMEGLDKRGYLVQTSNSAEDAALLLNEKPDIILLDALLPKMNGFEFCKRIRASKMGKDIPVVIMTGIYKQHFQEKEARLKHGASDYLLKPFTLERLEEVLATNLGTWERGEITQEGLGFKVEGSVATVPIEKLLKNIAETGKTGMLQVTRGKTVRRVYFVRGRITYAMSNIKADSISQQLVQSGRITEEDRERIDLYSREKRVSKERAILGLNVLSTQELLRCLEEMARTIVFGLLGWKDGDYKVVLKEQPLEKTLRIDLDMKKLLIQGIVKFIRKE